jgi:hypothetical protein
MMQMNRPALSAENFRAWYWLKKELQAYCRTQGLPTSGSKEDLTLRVQAHLSGRVLPPIASVSPRRDMPAQLTPETVIDSGWRLNDALRAFFVAHTGKGFRFNQALRDLFKNPQGKTLAQALTIYAASAQNSAQPIQRQFQFNQHIRDFFAQHPTATRAQALAAWQKKRETQQALVFPSHTA